MTANSKQKLELTWIGKGNEPKLEPRILIENPEYSYGDPNTDNMLIHGDNLLALKALEQDFAGKVKCIYIDPPYNTGNAFEHYDDGVEHSIWLNLMSQRLKILRNLLADNGSIWITLDENEVHYCKVMCDEIFGRKNFIISIAWNSRKSKQNDTIISLAHNHNLVYAKNIDKVQVNRMPINDDKFSNPDNDPNGDWVADPFDAPQIRPNLTYAIKNPNTGEEFWPPKGRHWRTGEKEYNEYLKNGRIIFGKTGNSKPQLKRYKKDAQLKGEAPNTWWDDCGTATEATQELIKIFTKDNLFGTPKPERLIERILYLGSKENDLVLDSFLGSGTTAAVAHKMGRRWIGVELGEHAKTHCFPRLKAVVDGEQGGISKAVNWQGGGGFKFYTLAPPLLRIDKFGNKVINTEYDAQMLAAAMAKQEGFSFQPDEQKYWKQGRSSEQDYIFTTTQYLTRTMLDAIAEDLLSEESLLVCCAQFEAGLENAYPNINLRKIPAMLLGRCEFKQDSDYSLNIVDSPLDELRPATGERIKPEAAKSKVNPKHTTDMPDLFSQTTNE